MTVWGQEFFLSFCFQTILNVFFDKMISFLTLSWMHRDGKCGDGSLFLVFCFHTIEGKGKRLIGLSFVFKNNIHFYT